MPVGIDQVVEQFGILPFQANWHPEDGGSFAKPPTP
jgi:hypothetical protein